MNSRYLAVAKRASHRCEYCHAPEAVFNFWFEIEHIVPLSKHGSGDLENLALACRSCNLFKADHLPCLEPDNLDSPALFHPRRQVWDEHFTLLPTGQLEALTSHGEKTIKLLRLNMPYQITARKMWMRLGLYP